MRIYDIINKKRYARELSREEIFFAINGFVSGEVADYQMSALAMAICINSMTEREVLDLTDAMLRSGDTINLSRFGHLSVDKHSTGGVGDKTTLIVAPIVASLGAKVAKMSGRGLGHTGGTVDKLEAFCDFKTSLSSEDFLKQVEKIGICVIGQSANLVPADKKLYALRDVSATVESIPLIASSIMSKKLASGSKNIVLDIKVGSGAFMKTESEARALAHAMIKIGKGFGRNVRAIITNMDTPLGKAVGNSLEVWEAIELLKGNITSELYEVCIALSSNMISCAFEIDIEEAKKLCINAVSNGSALKKMKEWIGYQGGDVSLICESERLLQASCKKDFKSQKCGYVSRIDAEKVGIAAMMLGAGRMKKDDIIDTHAGILLNLSIGDRVFEGDTLATLFSSSYDKFSPCEELLLQAFELSDEKPQKQNVIIDTI
ncbi:MAG: thymidine phosphorylase [Clostridia bacterium]|nr:thymidine phosphorylase [Clostridia bacterium]